MDIPTEEQARYIMEKAMRIHKKIEPKQLNKKKVYFVIPSMNARYIGVVSDENTKMKRIWQYTYGDFEKVNDKVNIDGASVYYEVPDEILQAQPPGFTSEDTSYSQMRMIPRMKLEEAALKAEPMKYANNSNNTSNNNSGLSRVASFRNKKNRRNRKSRKTRRYHRR